jgi:hypothetical protein
MTAAAAPTAMLKMAADPRRKRRTARCVATAGGTLGDLGAIQHERLLIVPDVRVRIEESRVVVFALSAAGGVELVDMKVEKLILVHEPGVDSWRGGLL